MLKDTIAEYNINTIEKKYELKQQEDKFKTKQAIFVKEKAQEDQIQYFIILISLILVVAVSLILYFQRESSKKIKFLNQKLLFANNSKDKLFTIISHDLRSPVHSLNDLLKVLHEYYDDYSKEELKQYVITLEKSTDNIALLLENLLVWSKLQLNGIKPQPKLLDLKSIVEKEIQNLKAVGAKKRISFNNNINKDTKVYADADMLAIVVRNLLSNSIKFSLLESTIDVKASLINADYVEIHVIDKGIGIKKEELSKLFEIDEKVSTIGTNNEKGSGLGLMICKELVQRNRGNIYIDSEFNAGTDICITLPTKIPN